MYYAFVRELLSSLRVIDTSLDKFTLCSENI